MDKSRDHQNLTYPHDLYRRFKGDDYFSFDERVAKVRETCEKRFSLARIGVFDKEEEEKEGNIVDKLLLENNLELEKLHQKGQSLMTNIRVACEQRKLEQREREELYEEGILENMQKQSSEVEEKLITIYERWDKLKSRLDEDPQKFLKTLKVLKSQIEDLIKTKDEVIQTIKSDLTRINSTYHAVLDKQDYDLHYMHKRVYDHLNNMKQCYVRQILELDDTINRFHREEYDRIYKCSHEFSTEIIVGTDTSEMLDNIDRKYEVERNHRAAVQAKFQELRIHFEEMTHTFRMQMEQDQEKIEMELEEMTATYFLNSLKFNYNYQVLEKKNSENVNKMVYEEKKKNWFKLVNLASDMRKQMKETKSIFESKCYDIADHTEKFRNRLLQLEVKNYNGAVANESKFCCILKMNLEEANHLITQICSFNKIFFEEHLGIRWESPDFSILNYRNLDALQRHRPINSNVSNQVDSKEKTVCATLKEVIKGTDDWKTLQFILKKMPTGMSYAMDRDLPVLMNLSEMSEKGRKLAELDNMFSALGIERLEDLSTLLKNLQLFAFCPNCEEEKIIDIHKRSIESNISPETSSSTKLAEYSFVPTVQTVETVSIDLDLMERIEDLNQIRKERKECSNHRKDISYAHIISAMELTIKSLEEEKLSEIIKDQETINVGSLNINFEQREHQIALLWDRYRTIFPEEHVHLWASLEEGLADYLLHLKKRFQLNTECDRLRKQNAQLKYMLQELL